MPLGGGRGGALRIGAGMGGFVGERGVTDAVAIALQRGEGGRRDRAGGVAGNARRVDRDHDHAGEKGVSASLPAAAARFSTLSTSRRSAKLLPEPDGPTIPARNGVCASATSAELGERLDRLADVLKIGAIAGVGVEKRLGDGRRRAALGAMRRRRGKSLSGGGSRASPRTAPQPIVHLALRSKEPPSAVRRAAASETARQRRAATIWPRRPPASSANPLADGGRPIAALQDAAFAARGRRAVDAPAPRSACFGNFSAMP